MRLLFSSLKEREKMGSRVLSSPEVMQQFPPPPMTLEHSPWQAGYSTGHIWNKLDLKEPIILAPVILCSLLSSLAVDNGFIYFDQIDWGAEWNRIYWKSSYPSSSQSAKESNSGESLFPSGRGRGREQGPVLEFPFSPCCWYGASGMWVQPPPLGIIRTATWTSIVNRLF